VTSPALLQHNSKVPFFFPSCSVDSAHSFVPSIYQPTIATSVRGICNVQHRLSVLLGIAAYRSLIFHPLSVESGVCVLFSVSSAQQALSPSYIVQSTQRTTPFFLDFGRAWFLPWTTSFHDYLKTLLAPPPLLILLALQQQFHSFFPSTISRRRFAQFLRSQTGLRTRHLSIFAIFLREN
jgi:hypothetical protein